MQERNFFTKYTWKGTAIELNKSQFYFLFGYSKEKLKK